MKIFGATVIAIVLVCSIFYFWGRPFIPPELVLPKKISSMSELDPYLETATKNRTPPSISISVIGQNKILDERFYGFQDIKQIQKTTNQTVYQWWSLTKLFTAVAILQLEEKKLLNIDDPAEKYFPDFKVRGLKNQNEPITIKQILSHSAGLDDVGMSILGWVHFENDLQIRQTELIKKKLNELNKLIAQPGTEGNYSNFGYIVLAGIIEQVTGDSYETYISENILKPLGMKNTGFVYSDSMRASEAIGSHPKDFISRIVPIYLDTKKAIKEETHGMIWFNRVYSDQKGSTGLIGSVADFTKFVQMILNKGELNGVRILSLENIERMQEPIIPIRSSPAPDSSNLSFGLSWFIGNQTGNVSLSHGGAGMAYVTLLRVYPNKKYATVVFANSTYLGRTMGLDLINLIEQLNWQ